MNCYKTVATSKWHSGSLTGRRFKFPMPDAFGKIRQLLAMNRSGDYEVEASLNLSIMTKNQKVKNKVHNINKNMEA